MGERLVERATGGVGPLAEGGDGGVLAGRGAGRVRMVFAERGPASEGLGVGGRRWGGGPVG